MHHYSHTEHHNLLYEYPCAVQQEIQLIMLSKLTVGVHTTHRPAKISLILFVLAVMGCVIGLISREFGALTVRKNVLIDGCNFFDNGLNFNALLPNIIDTYDTTGAVYSASNFINLRTTVALNSSITFDLTAVLVALLATTIRIENKDIFDHETQSLHITHQPACAFVFNNIDNGLRESGAVGYVHDIILDGILDGIAFDWVVDRKLECYVNEKFYFNNGMCIFASLRNFSVARRECFVCFTLCQGVYFVS